MVKVPSRAGGPVAVA